MAFLEELKNRRVVRALTVYVAAAWVVAQVVSEVVAPALALGDAAVRWVAIVSLAGLPVVAIVSWVFNIFPSSAPAKGEDSTRESWVSVRSVVAVVALLAAGAAMGWVAGAVGANDDPGAARALAVLPFESLTGEEDRYLSDGLTEDLVVALQKAADFGITGRASTERYRDLDLATSQIAEELGVQYLVTGSVRRSGDQLRVSVQLADAEGRGLWTEQFDQRLTVENVFDMYTEVAESVAASVRARLAPDAAQRLAERPTESLVAYDLYMRGRSFWSRRLPELMGTAIEYFDRAIEEDPSYARAHAGRADALILEAFYQAGDASRIAGTAARDAAQRALTLDPGLAEAHTSFGYATWLVDWDWTAAEASLRTAIELNPDHPTAHHWLGDLLGQQLRTAESLAHLDRALERDPYAIAIHFDRAKALIWAGRYEEAIGSLERALEIEPGYFTVTAGLHANALHELERDQEAIALFVRYVEAIEGPGAASDLQRVYDAGGWEAFEESLLTETLAAARAGQDPFFLAGAYAAAGRREEALAALRRGVDSRSFFSINLYADPAIRDLLWGDPLYEQLLRDIGLDPAELTGDPE